MKLAAIFSLTLAIIYIFLESLHPSFYMHLSTDMFVYQARSLYFWQHLNLTQLGHNEYQPGAILFFISLGPAFIFDTSLETYKWALFLANILLIIATAFLLHKMGKTAGIIFLALILIFLGPILLFRFDLFVIFLVTLAFYFWEKEKFSASMAVLSFGVLVKVYPILFLPYLLWLSFKKYKFQKAFLGGAASSAYLLAMFLMTLIAYFLLYTIIFQISFKDTLVSYNFHNMKSVSTESVWSSLFYFGSIIQGIPFPSMESDFGINAVSRAEVFPSLTFYNYFWILPLGILNLFYIIKKKTVNGIDYKFLMLNILIFLVFSKVLANQYLGWFLFLVPLINLKTLLKKSWIINIFLILLTTFLHTFIYPLNYTEWLGVLNKRQPDLILTSVMLFSSLILVILAVRITYDVFKTNSEPLT